MRLFLGVELESPVAEALDLAIAPLREAEPELAWVPRGKLHLTMKFLGDVDAAGVDGVAGAIDRIVARHRPFDMRLEGVGAFPNFRRPHVVWIGVEAEPRLELLHHDLEVACEALGYEVEGRAFRPHITLARLRAPLPPERARRFARVARGVDFASETAVASVVLMESTLAPSGARYRRVHATTLGER